MPIQKGPLGNDIGSSEIAAGAVTYAKLASDIQRSGMKNRIINGAMVIDQRNAGASVTLDGSESFPVDRFACGDVTDGAFTAQQVTDAPAGFINSLKCTITTADTSLAATQAAYCKQNIEGFNVADLGWGTANAKTVTLSFWVKSSLTGTFGGALRNSGASRSYPFSYTISSASTWEQKTVTITGDTTGTWLTTNGVGIDVQFSLGAGSSRTGTAGAWNANNNVGATGQVQVIGTNGATWQITGVQLEVGSSATGFEYRQYGQELALCQRYFEKSYDVGVALGTIDQNGSYGFRATNTSSAYNFPFRFAVTKRAIPTMTYYNPVTGASGSFYNGTGAASVTIAGSTGIGTTGIMYISDSGGGATAGSFYYVHTAANSEL